MFRQTLATRAVFFDLGGTLFIIRHHKILRMLLQEEGRAVELASIHAAYMKVEPWWLSVYGNQRIGPEGTDEAYRVLDERVVLELFPDEAPSDAVEFSKKVRVKGPEIEDAFPPELFPDAEPLLQRLRADGYSMGLISNATVRTRRVVEATGLTNYLDPIVISAEVGYLKPRPEIFRIALARANVRADEAIHVGDLYESDIVGARNAGMKGILIDRDGTSGGPDCPKISSLGEVYDFIAWDCLCVIGRSF